ncbi:hypothetical protein YC2023_050636 [Brassica napus]
MEIHWQVTSCLGVKTRERFRRRRRLPFSLISVLLLLLHRSLTLSWLLGEGPGLSFFDPARPPCARESIWCRFAPFGSLARSWFGFSTDSHRSLVLVESFSCGGGLCFALRVVVYGFFAAVRCHITSNIPALSLSTTSRVDGGLVSQRCLLVCHVCSSPFVWRLASLVSCYCCADTVWSEFSDNFNPFFGRLVFRGAVHYHNPEVLWAQRSDKVYLTVALPDAKDISVKCEPQGLFTFSALGTLGKLFEFSLELYGKVVPEYRKNVTNWNLLHQSSLEQI